jgi:hypothetical protein
MKDEYPILWTFTVQHKILPYDFIILSLFKVQSNLSYVTFQGNIEIGSHKTGGHLIQV